MFFRVFVAGDVPLLRSRRDAMSPDDRPVNTPQIEIDPSVLEQTVNE
jgi:hypothetical protein